MDNNDNNVNSDDNNEIIRTGTSNNRSTSTNINKNRINNSDKKRDSKPMADGYNDDGSADRYFYYAKASKKDRDEGLNDFEESNITDGRKTLIDNAFQRGETLRKNIHPTVKPTELMQYLIRLISPKGATILDCFNGSGSTGKAAMYENIERNANYKYIGIDLDEEYLSISKARIDYVLNMEFTPNLFDWSEDNE